MKRFEAKDIKQYNLLKHYRIIRKWAARNNDLTESDLELLIYLDCIDLFSKIDFKMGAYSYSWNNRRWNRLLKKGWIVVWRKRNRTTQKYHLYEVSFKCKQLIQRVYRIMLGEEDLPISKRRNKLIAGSSYTDKVMTQAIYNVNKDKNR
ncbi:MAG: hypothetical protein K0U52_08500 [Gammaproteobacteria bacterium]|nr:hypothetical protein [Gammaproteobacteria bacterium]